MRHLGHWLKMFGIIILMLQKCKVLTRKNRRRSLKYFRRKHETMKWKRIKLNNIKIRQFNFMFDVQFMTHVSFEIIKNRMVYSFVPAMCHEQVIRTICHRRLFDLFVYVLCYFYPLAAFQYNNMWNLNDRLYFRKLYRQTKILIQLLSILITTF